MAFKAITKGSWGGETQKTTARISTNAGQLIVTLPVAMLRSIGSPRYVEAMIGTGPDAGWLRLQAAATKPGAYSVSKNGKSAGSVKVGIGAKQVGASGVKIKSTEVEHTTERDAICVFVGPVIKAARNESATARVNSARELFNAVAAE
jgi:hypothetical protein